MLISQPGSDYQVTQITLDAGHTRDIIHLLLDVHSVLDVLHLDGSQPQITAPASELLRYTGSRYTLPTLIEALDDIINQLTRTMRDAFSSLSPHPNEPCQDPGSF
ncbi:MAG: hypothetical protein ACRDND_16015 [Streptosporangiaceae bacterium]